MSVTAHRLSVENIERSARVIDPVFTGTPQYNCEPLSQALGADLVLKVETLNPIRSFKGRGADFFMSETRETFRDQKLPMSVAAIIDRSLFTAQQMRTH
jgi:threonine dehydratase